MASRTDSPWKVEGVIERLKVLWATHSATEITDVLGREFGVYLTRSAVIGRLHRMKLTISDKTKTHPLTRVRTKHGPRTPRVSRTRSTPFRSAPVLSYEEATFQCSEIEPRNLKLLDLQHGDCRYPVNDGAPADFLFCGHIALKDMPYCAGHTRICRQDPKPRAGLRPKMPQSMADGIQLRGVMA